MYWGLRRCWGGGRWKHQNTLPHLIVWIFGKIINSLTINSWAAKSVPAGTKNSRSEGFLLGKHLKHTAHKTPPPWWSRFPLQHHGFDWWTHPTPGSLFGRGWTRPPSKGLIYNYKVNEKLMYFYSLSVNYNNSSPAIGNDSQNGINCCRRATIIYELTNNI